MKACMKWDRVMVLQLSLWGAGWLVCLLAFSRRIPFKCLRSTHSKFMISFFCCAKMLPMKIDKLSGSFPDALSEAEVFIFYGPIFVAYQNILYCLMPHRATALRSVLNASNVLSGILKAELASSCVHTQ